MGEPLHSAETSMWIKYSWKEYSTQDVEGYNSNQRKASFQVLHYLQLPLFK